MEKIRVLMIDDNVNLTEMVKEYFSCVAVDGFMAWSSLELCVMGFILCVLLNY